MAPKERRKIQKRSAGLVIPAPAPRPDADNRDLALFAEAKAAQETTHHPPATTHRPPTTQPVAPERDFVRVPNSVVRDALPAGLFKGESKKTYDALYQRTRGSVVPRWRLRATLSDVMAWAGVSHNTLKAHLKHLARVGLVVVHYTRGDNTGAEYEVLTPEEAPPTTHQPQTTRPPATGQILGPPTSQNVVLGGGGQTPDFQRATDEGKTSFKTKDINTDDEAFRPLLARLKRVTTDITGKKPSAAEAGKWDEIGEVLETELKIAAGRTTVSSVPAFLAEHLRRRLFKKDKAQLAAETPPQGQQAPKIGPTETCPDCFNTGLFYPEGYEKGVARCLHPKLKGKGQP